MQLFLMNFTAIQNGNVRTVNNVGINIFGRMFFLDYGVKGKHFSVVMCDRKPDNYNRDAACEMTITNQYDTRGMFEVVTQHGSVEDLLYISWNDLIGLIPRALLPDMVEGSKSYVCCMPSCTDCCTTTKGA